MPATPPDRLLSRPFVVVTLACAAFFVSFGSTIPVLPRYVSDELGQGDAVVGLVAGSFAVSAIVLRPFIGRWGDRYGRRILIVVGCVLTAAGHLGHVVAESVPVLVAMRLLIGAGQGGFFVGAATLVADLSPPARRGEAASYFSIALYLGLGVGPFIGEALLAARSFDAVWVFAGTGGLLAAALGTTLPARVRAAAPGPTAPVAASPEAPPTPGDGAAVAPEGAGPGRRRAPLFHPAGIGPGAVLGLGVIGFVGFNTFVPLFGEGIGLDDVAPVFLLYSFVVVSVRLFGARLPDRLGPARAGSAALAATGGGLLVAATWQAPVGLYVGTAVLALGSSLLYPALNAAAVNAVDDDERSRVVATFTVFFEVGTALGGLVLGVVAAATTYAGAFVGGAVSAGCGLVLLWTWLVPRLGAAARPADTAGAGTAGADAA